MGMMIRHNRSLKAKGAVEPAPTSVVKEVKTEGTTEKTVEKTEKRGRKKTQ